MEWEDPYEWDWEKNRTNFAKHGIRFEEAREVFDDAETLESPDESHSWDEERWIAIGRLADWRIIMLVYVIRGSKIRIISARPATASERRSYERRERR